MKLIEEKTVNVSFSLEAISKIMYLVMHETAEIGWRGICKRATDFDDNDAGYYVQDIIVYPQTVGPATVDTDEEELGLWENKLSDDVFNNMRLHGHSHVAMDVTPSVTDVSHQKKILKQLGPDDFYIFIIVNKNFKFHFDIYDKRSGYHYENDDVTYSFIGLDIPDMSVVKKKTLAPSKVFGVNDTNNYARHPINFYNEDDDYTGSDLYDILSKYDDIGKASNKVSTIWDDIEGGDKQ